ncbi:carbohydrate esterase family 5 protein [Periconia macrospinosa]|uniref:Cutinase n=1 Tax=Periconia macrospinosa TaxID=97972 RepID=A0A2V1DPY7_9PLEO|nr:carbohydrate esterase family 5 protein [Periconia macrospinosa]
MKFLALTTLFALGSAIPVEPSIVHRQAVVTSRTELESGSASACPKVIFIWARGSTEPGNMGDGLGPTMADVLEAKYGASNVWVQGVGGPYNAGLLENLGSKGTSQAAIDEAKRLFVLASTKCPSSKIVSAGYSQGSAVIAGAIPDLTAAQRNKVIGIVFFGYTRNKQNNGGISSYPQSNLQVYCDNGGDLVCEGTLLITASHFSYDDEAAGVAPQFLISKIGA